MLYPDEHTRQLAEHGTVDPTEALDAARRDAAGCQACPLWETATQTVFGDGAADARLMLIAEAPGEHEDQLGVPFVGPAGLLLDRALAVAGIERGEVYITNVVKHRPWILQNGRRKNRAPRASEIKACRPWLQRELEIVSPEIILCMGAPAAHQILGKEFRLTEQRGQWLTSAAAPHVLATIHPAYVLIQPEETHAFWRDALFADFTKVGERLRALEGDVSDRRRSAWGRGRTSEQLRGGSLRPGRGLARWRGGVHWRVTTPRR